MRLIVCAESDDFLATFWRLFFFTGLFFFFKPPPPPPPSPGKAMSRKPRNQNVHGCAPRFKGAARSTHPPPIMRNYTRNATEQTNIELGFSNRCFLVTTTQGTPQQKSGVGKARAHARSAFFSTNVERRLPIHSSYTTRSSFAQKMSGHGRTKN